MLAGPPPTPSSPSPVLNTKSSVVVSVRGSAVQSKTQPSPIQRSPVQVQSRPLAPHRHHRGRLVFSLILFPASRHKPKNEIVYFPALGHSPVSENKLFAFCVRYLLTRFVNPLSSSSLSSSYCSSSSRRRRCRLRFRNRWHPNPTCPNAIQKALCLALSSLGWVEQVPKTLSPRTLFQPKYPKYPAWGLNYLKYPVEGASFCLLGHPRPHPAQVRS